MEFTDQEVREVIKDEKQRERFIEVLIENYSQSILWLAYTYVSDRQLAEEIMQDVFLTCYKKIDAFRNESSIKTWMYRITVNKCKDHLRKRKVRAFLSFQTSHAEEVAVDQSHPESITFTAIEDQELSERVLALPTKFKEVIFLHYFEDMKIKEIAEVLGTNVNTVKTRLNRGRTTLKKMYKEGEQ